jgi:hypothetical protein
MAYQSVAGQFFPVNITGQKSMVEALLKAAKEVEIRGQITGLIVPHAGWIYSGVVAAAGYKALGAQKGEVKKIILVGPSHREYFGGVRKGVVDHSVEVQVPFIKTVVPEAEIIPIVYGEITYKDLAKEIEMVGLEQAVVVASSDLSHYLPYDSAVRADSLTNQSIEGLDLDKMEIEGDACGKTGIMALMVLAKNNKWKVKLLDSRNSGDTAGDKSAVVGYSCFAFYE